MSFVSSSPNESCYVSLSHYVVPNDFNFKTKYNSNKLFKLRAGTEFISETPKKVLVYVYSGFKQDVCLGSKPIKTLSLKTNSEGFASCNFSKLPVGQYTINLVAVGEYPSCPTSCLITISKAPTIVSAPKVIYKYHSKNYFKVAIMNKFTKKLVGDLAVKIKVYTGKKYKNYIMKTNSKGVAKLSTKYLKKGKHKVVISSGNKNYNISKNGNLIVIK